MDAQNWIPVAQGTWANDKTVKTTLFTPIVARYVSMVVTSEAAGVGNQWASAAEHYRLAQEDLARQRPDLQAEELAKPIAQGLQAALAAER